MRMAGEKIIVRVPNWLGDCIMATPMIRRLREKNPDAHIALMGLSVHREIFEGNPNINATLLYDSFKGAGNFLRAASDLFSARFDTGYILPNSLSSAALFALGRVKNKIGYNAENRGWLLDNKIPWPGQVEHRTPRYLRLMDNQPDISEAAKSYIPEMRITGDDHALADKLLAGVDTSHAIAINPCSITPTRRWFPERFAELADRARKEMGLQTVLVGGPSKEDTEAAARVEELCRSAKPANLQGKTKIKTMAAVLAKLKLLVTGNTGTMHIASTVGTPMVIITGSSDINVTAPWGVEYRVIQKDLPCYPCWKNQCPYRPERPECMEIVTVEDVFKELADLMTPGN
jgi:heptosyltransferase-2